MQDLISPQVGEDDRAAAGAALVDFSRAAASDDGNGVVAAGLRLARAGGFRGLVDLMERSGHHGSDELNRQWYWLAAVARYAAERNDTHTAVLAFLFADLWRQQVAPRNNLGNLDEIGFPAPPERVQADLAALAMAFLADQNPELVVAQGSAATVTVRIVLVMLASRIVDLAAGGLDIKPSLVNGAHQIMLHLTS
jgi:hypothetical protein